MPNTNSQTTIDAAERHEMIERAAYRRAEQRGFNGGDQLEDWLAAEREIDALLGGGSTHG